MQTDLKGMVRAADTTRLEPHAEPKGSRYLFAGIVVASIWLAVAVASIWSPDMITGSEHEHIPIAAFTGWLYAAIATGLVLMAFSRRTLDAGRSLWMGFTDRDRRHLGGRGDREHLRAEHGDGRGSDDDP